VTPQLNDLKETALYVEDMARAKSFYKDVMGLSALVEDWRFCALDVAGKHILLLFLRGASLENTILPNGGVVPPHDGAGQLHVGFAVDPVELVRWKSHLSAHGVAVESEISWPAGGRGIYFRDPDGHLLELLTPGVWKTY